MTKRKYSAKKIKLSFPFLFFLPLIFFKNVVLCCQGGLNLLHCWDCGLQCCSMQPILCLQTYLVLLQFFTLSKLKLHIHIFMLLSHIQELSSHIGTVATILDCEDLGRVSNDTHTTNINANMQTPFHSLDNICMYTLNLCKVSWKQKMIT